MGTATFKHSEALDRIVNHALDNGLAVLLVKDEGLYLMVETLRIADGSRALCAYAEGCDPEADDDWYDNARDAFGGDDGVEQFPPQEIAALIRDGHSLEVSFSESHITLRALA